MISSEQEISQSNEHCCVSNLKSLKRIDTRSIDGGCVLTMVTGVRKSMRFDMFNSARLIGTDCSVLNFSPLNLDNAEIKLTLFPFIFANPLRAIFPFGFSPIKNS